MFDYDSVRLPVAKLLLNLNLCTHVKHESLTGLIASDSRGRQGAGIRYRGRQEEQRQGRAAGEATAKTPKKPKPKWTN